MQDRFTKLYTWSHKYYNLKLPQELFRYSAKLCLQSGKCSTTKKMHVVLERDCICSKICHINNLLTASLKRKTGNMPIIIRRMTAEKRARAVGIPRQGARMRQVSHFPPRIITNPDHLLTNFAVYDKTNRIHHFLVASHFGLRHVFLFSEICSKWVMR